MVSRDAIAFGAPGLFRTPLYEVWVVEVDVDERVHGQLDIFCNLNSFAVAIGVQTTERDLTSFVLSPPEARNPYRPLLGLAWRFYRGSFGKRF